MLFTTLETPLPLTIGEVNTVVMVVNFVVTGMCVASFGAHWIEYQIRCRSQMEPRDPYRSWLFCAGASIFFFAIWSVSLMNHLKMTPWSHQFDVYDVNRDLELAVMGSVVLQLFTAVLYFFAFVLLRGQSRWESTLVGLTALAEDDARVLRQRHSDHRYGIASMLLERGWSKKISYSLLVLGATILVLMLNFAGIVIATIAMMMLGLFLFHTPWGARYDSFYWDAFAEKFG